MNNENLNSMIKDRVISIISKDTNHLSANSLYNSIVNSPSVNVEISQSSFLRTISYNNNTINFYVVIAICQYYGISYDSLLNSDEVPVSKIEDNVSDDICGTYNFIAYLTEKGKMDPTSCELSIEIKGNKYFAILKDQYDSLSLSGYGKKSEFNYLFELFSEDRNKQIILLVNLGPTKYQEIKRFFGIYYFYNKNFRYYHQHAGKFYATTKDITKSDVRKISLLLNINNSSIEVRKVDLDEIRKKDKQFDTFADIFFKGQKFSNDNISDGNNYVYKLYDFETIFLSNTNHYVHLRRILIAGDPPEYKLNEDVFYYFAVSETIECFFKLLSISKLNKRYLLCNIEYNIDKEILFEYFIANREIEHYINGEPYRPNMAYIRYCRLWDYLLGRDKKQNQENE